jgi:DNA polymerase-3 subunit gamma/tau
VTDVEASAPPSSARSAAGGSSLALYRKYRSSTFAEVIGQDHVTVPLRQALAANRINHAYLFSGPRGCGKTSSARILARSLNCIQGPTPDPCGVCDSCKELAPNGPGSIDVIEIDAASHGGVDDARDLRERAFFAPVRDRFKVYIVDEAHMVSNQGFNALLKLVEEPPDFLVFVFATTEPDKVLTTIRSRTHHYPFRLIPPTVMRAHLETICTAEGIAVEPAVLPLVVRAGGGSARDSLSILDQLLAGAGPDGVTYSSAIALLGVTDGALLDDMVDALAAGDAAGVYGTVDRVVEAGHDPRRFSVDLLDRFRDLILLDAVPDAGERGLIDVPQDQLAHMADQALRLGGASLTRYAEIVHTALIEMRGTTAARLVLELLCARMMLPDASTDAAAVLQRVERLERRLAVAGDSASAVTHSPKQADKPVTPSKATSKPSAPAGPAAERAHEAQPTATVRPEATERPAAVASAAPRKPAEPPAAPAAAAPVPATESATAPVTVPATTPGDPGVLDANALRRLWPEVLEVVKLTSRRTRALLDNAQITEVSGELVTLAAPGALAKMISDDSNTSVLRAALTKIVGGEWKISVDGAPVAASAGEATSPGGAAPAEESDPRDDADYEPAPRDGAAAPQNDPEAEAMKLLRDQLGARPLEG